MTHAPLRYNSPDMVECCSWQTWATLTVNSAQLLGRDDLTLVFSQHTDEAPVENEDQSDQSDTTRIPIKTIRQSRSFVVSIPR